MTATATCPVCHTPAPPDWTSSEPWLCSMACFRAHWDIPEPVCEAPIAMQELVEQEVTT
jgi:hypothetical protein